MNTRNKYFVIYRDRTKNDERNGLYVMADDKDEAIEFAKLRIKGIGFDWVVLDHEDHDK